MVGMFVCLCLAGKKPSEREFFVPARTDLGVKQLAVNRNTSIMGSGGNKKLPTHRIPTVGIV
jgi:hypothetical protein